MAQLAVYLFGSFAITIEQQPITTMTSERVRALFSYLTVEADRVHSRQSVAGMLWPDFPQDRALQNLRQTLIVMRRSLGKHPIAEMVLAVTRQTLQINPELDWWLDVTAFSNQIAASERDRDKRIATWQQAIEHYRGDFLQGFDTSDSPLFEEWALMRREHYARQALRALNGLAHHFERLTDYDQAIDYAQRQLALEPWQEETHRQVIRCLALSGQRSAALAHYETCRRILDEELAIPPAEETTVLYEQIRDGNFTPLPSLSNASAPPPASAATPPPSYLILSRLDPLPDQKLFGIEAAQARLEAVIQNQARPWLVAIDGIGGIGKTTLAHRLVHRLVQRQQFADIGWVSAKQQEFLPDMGISSLDKPTWDAESLTDALLQQLDDRPYVTASAQEKKLALMQLLKERPHLIIVDNLETVADYQTLLPYLRQLANPSKFLITSRFSLKSQSDVYSHSLSELSQPNALALLQHEAELRGIAQLQQASETQLMTIYAVVGGNPLALKLVIGQLGFLPLTDILDNLREAQGQRVDQLYTYIYWQAWAMMDEPTRELFVGLPISPNATFKQLLAVNELDSDQIQHSLQQLIALSLVEVNGNLEQPRYRLHRLTETFLMNEVLKWR